MSRRAAWVAGCVFVVGAIAPALRAQSLPVPASWRWVTDAPVEHQTALSPPEGRWLFGVMAPGWHITTRPGAVLFEPAYLGKGRYALEAETFLFPTSSQAGLGLLVGGRDLEGPAARYLAFLIRRDGGVSIERRADSRIVPLVAWTPKTDIVASPTDQPARNVLRVEVEDGLARLMVNGKLAAQVERPNDEFDGIVGLRIGADIDLHVTNLDLTLRLARPRPAARPN